MHNLIIWVRHLRNVVAFKFGSRTTVLVLMLLGIWVATRSMDVPIDQILSDKLIHIIVFFGFALLMDLAISRHPFWLWKGMPLLVYGILIEIMQFYAPDREFSFLDIVANLIGIMLYFMVKMLLIWFDSMSIEKH